MTRQLVLGRGANAALGTQGKSQGQGQGQATGESPPPANQPALRFFFEAGDAMEGQTSYQIRQQLKAALAAMGLPAAPLDQISVRTGASSIAISARKPEAGTWMLGHVAPLMECMAAIGKSVLEVDPVVMVPRVGASGKTTKAEAAGTTATAFGPTLYVIPRLIVAKAKSKAPWSAWQQPDLDAETQAQMKDLIAEGLRSEMKAWDLDAGFMQSLTLIDAGRPMVISPAEGPRGLARLGVKFMANATLEGDFFVGHHTLVGHGHIVRGGTTGSKTATSTQAEAELDVPTELSNTATTGANP